MRHQTLAILASALLIGTSVNAANEISCTPSIVYPGEKLTIKTSRAFSDLAVSLPYKINNSTIAFLTEIDPKTAIIDSKKFMQEKGIQLNVDSATFNHQAPVFANSGIYKFIVSTNLETDDGTPKFSCSVQFVSSGRVKSKPTVTKNMSSAE